MEQDQDTTMQTDQTEEARLRDKQKSKNEDRGCEDCRTNIPLVNKKGRRCEDCGAR